MDGGRRHAALRIWGQKQLRHEFSLHFLNGQLKVQINIHEHHSDLFLHRRAGKRAVVLSYYRLHLSACILLHRSRGVFDGSFCVFCQRYTHRTGDESVG